LILGDDTGAYLSSPNSPFAYYGNNATSAPAVAERIRTFQKAVHESTLKSTLNGYDFTKPNLSLLQTATGTAGRGENHEFGTDLATQTYHQQLATTRLERQNVVRATATGSATAPDLRAGYTFTLTDATGSGLGGAYVVTSVRHAGFTRVTNGVSTLYYGNEFEVIPAAQKFRPALRTPKPLAQVCTAVVTGPAGERVHVDEYGRVKVSFHWDRSGVTDDRSSAWLRVASPMAGSSYDGHGMLFLPRVGDEVLVSFIQGDPDQPVVTGSLYNANAMPPYALPADKWTSTIRSASDSGNVNEIRFDDTAGSEELAVFAGKDLTTDVPNNLTTTVGQNSVFSAGNNFSLQTGNALTIQAPQIAMNGSLTVNGVPYSTNSVAVWAAVAANGTISAQQGIASVVNNQQGYYTITVSRAAPSASALIPIAIANLNALPTTPAAMRVAAVDQVTSSSFRVYIMSGTGVATNSAFVVMVTGN
jgi:type VI secretion system secreted protein VgrG